MPVAGPITYEVNGKQYIAVNAGWNSAIVHQLSSGRRPFSVGPARLLVFALGAYGVTLPPAPPVAAIPPPPVIQEPPTEVAAGEVLYSSHCAICHGQNAVGSGAKDLRYLTPEAHASFDGIVLGGKLQRLGMEPFRGVLTKGQVDAIHAFVIARAQEDWQPDFLHPPKRK